jgi:hypothetical protein
MFFDGVSLFRSIERMLRGIALCVWLVEILEQKISYAEFMKNLKKVLRGMRG